MVVRRGRGGGSWATGRPHRSVVMVIGRTTLAAQPSGAWWREVLLRRDELECQAVVAVPLSSWGRTITKDMALMASAPDAVILDARQNQLEVSLGADPFLDRGKEAGPARAAVEFCRRLEQRKVARRADVRADSFFIVQRAGAGWFGRLLEEHSVGVVRQQRLPFIQRLLERTDRLAHDLRGPERDWPNHRTTAPTVRINMNVTTA